VLVYEDEDYCSEIVLVPGGEVPVDGAWWVVVVGFRSEYGGSSKDEDDDAVAVHASEDGGKSSILGVVGLRVNVANGYVLFFLLAVVVRQ
jgi:hypothetical protein